jgi:hypothetical protein
VGEIIGPETVSLGGGSDFVGLLFIGTFRPGLEENLSETWRLPERVSAQGGGERPVARSRDRSAVVP